MQPAPRGQGHQAVGCQPAVVAGCVAGLLACMRARAARVGAGLQSRVLAMDGRCQAANSIDRFELTFGSSLMYYTLLSLPATGR